MEKVEENVIDLRMSLAAVHLLHMTSVGDYTGIDFSSGSDVSHRFSIDGEKMSRIVSHRETARYLT